MAGATQRLPPNVPGTHGATSLDAASSRDSICGLARRDCPVVSATGIAQLCALTGATPRTLRYYEEKGLLRSSRSRTGARIFTPEQCDIAVSVVLLRRLGVPLSQVTPILEARLAVEDRNLALRELLKVRAADLEHCLDQVRSALGPEAGSARLPRLGSQVGA